MHNEDFLEFNEYVDEPEHPKVIARYLAAKIKPYARGMFREDDDDDDVTILERFFAEVMAATGETNALDTEERFPNLVKNWGGVKSTKHAVATYFYLHSVKPGRKFAQDIDRQIFNGLTFEEANKRPVPGGFESEYVPSPQPNLLEAPKRTETFHYTNTDIKVLGREDQQAKLLAFVDAGPGFRWLQIAGEGGQGKSRLAYDLITILKGRKDWAQGYFGYSDLVKFSENWADWVPQKPHLIVIDYVVGAEKQIGEMMQALAERFEEFGVAVCVLLLERQQWNKGGLSLDLGQKTKGDAKSNLVQSNGRAEWFEKLRVSGRHDLGHEDFRFGSGIIELKNLRPPDLTSIVRQIAEDLPDNIDDRFIEQNLERIDKAGRPLYAYFLGEVLAQGNMRSDWTREDLLDEVLRNDQSKRWKHAFLDENIAHQTHWELPLDCPSLQLAVLATMVRVASCKRLSTEFGWKRYDETVKRRALALTGGPKGTGFAEPVDPIAGLEPDILGEWFVLKTLTHRDGLEQLADIAWSYAPKEMANFLVRVTRDFPEHQAVYELVGIEPSSSEQISAYTSAVINIFANLVRARQHVPENIVKAIQKGAETHDSDSMFVIGYSYYAGKFVEKNYTKAAKWFRKAADANHLISMHVLGAWYYGGLGGNEDFAEAVIWFRKAADAGVADAAHSLGGCYYEGRGIEQDFAEAAIWYRKAADAGVADAMHDLGVCYYEGQGIEQDFAEAVTWFRKAAETGFADSIYNLGVCYAEGMVVKQDDVEAVVCFRKAADAGLPFAMYDVGVSYTEGRGIEQDFAEAVTWFRKAANAGVIDAMYDVGVCYFEGLGIPQNFTEAISWFRVAAALGNRPAMEVLKNWDL